MATESNQAWMDTVTWANTSVEKTPHSNIPVILITVVIIVIIIVAFFLGSKTPDPVPPPPATVPQIKDKERDKRDQRGHDDRRYGRSYRDPEPREKPHVSHRPEVRDPRSPPATDRSYRSEHDRHPHTRDQRSPILRGREAITNQA